VHVHLLPQIYTLGIGDHRNKRYYLWPALVVFSKIEYQCWWKTMEILHLMKESLVLLSVAADQSVWEIAQYFHYKFPHTLSHCFCYLLVLIHSCFQPLYPIYLDCKVDLKTWNFKRKLSSFFQFWFMIFRNVYPKANSNLDSLFLLIILPLLSSYLLTPIPHTCPIITIVIIIVTFMWIFGKLTYLNAIYF
jgi:hypothetical protein